MSSQGSTSIWLSSLFFAKGMPRVVVFVIVLLLFKQMGLGASEALCSVSLFYLPWVLKVWWKPRIVSKYYRLLILTTQFLLALTFALLAFLLTSLWLTISLLVLLSWLTAIHNVAADNFARLCPLSYHHSVVQELFRKFGLIGRYSSVTTSSTLGACCSIFSQVSTYCCSFGMYGNCPAGSDLPTIQSLRLSLLFRAAM